MSTSTSRAVPALLQLVFLTLVSSCSAAFFTSERAEPLRIQGMSGVANLPTPSADETPGMGCYYTWASRELPELGHALTTRLEDIGDAEAGAYAFGEDCHHEDGTVEFLTMESDFRVRIIVPNLADEAALGELIRQVMAALETIPQDEIPGPRPGRVEFEFTTGVTSSVRLTIYIDRYRQEVNGLRGAELYRHFLVNP